MKHRINATLIVSTLLCLLPMVLSALLFNRLPDQIAIHFDIQGKADGFASKAFAAFGIPLILAGLNIIVQIILESDPKKNNGQPLRFLSKWLIACLGIFIIPMTLFISLGYAIRVQTFVTVFVSLVFIITGNYLPKCKQNFTVGIRLPWTLNSEENWYKTHRVAGWVWTIGGMVLLLSSLTSFLPAVTLFTVLTLLVSIPAAYSYQLYRKGLSD
ncbi:putative integral membrane protein [Sphaerochaeta pleomorpha str. Grapes]|uniref:Putative integral membrane protein n=1 Tax=Sphaerochaeta pleomorpha (strain ATCC BAA-1885 / DSM 22778 / Grapes) TaxID=158190 RepID=G8QS84_SPHPG|nr:SdpI family protein [Sphaerochaeta pleomorpha]AEV28945.1 putative integral membrane protein [Sphaerochaeta pleomorpha str. Grapes]